MGSIADHVCKLLGDLVRSQVEPVAAAVSPSAADRATNLGARLAFMFAGPALDDPGTRRPPIEDTHESAKTLLWDIYEALYARVKAAMVEKIYAWFSRGGSATA
jgi:hypothetical protein